MARDGDKIVPLDARARPFERASTTPRATNPSTGADSTRAGGRGQKPRGARADHLLRFTRARTSGGDRSASSARASGGRGRGRGRGTTTRARDKSRELFLQSNFRFMLVEYADLDRASRDADRMVSWEDVVAVEHGSVGGVTCPICLDEAPTAPQTTTCGHAFCFGCIARHALTTRESGKPSKCPVCAVEYRLGDLRSVRSTPIEPPRVGKRQKFTLMQRRRDSTVPSKRDAKATPAPAPGQWPRALPHCGCDSFAKYTLTSEEVAIATAELESLEARVAALAEESDVAELPFALAAIDCLTRRLDRWVERRCAYEGVDAPRSRAPPPGVAVTPKEPTRRAEPEAFPALPARTRSTTAFLKGSEVVVESAFTDDEEEEADEDDASDDSDAEKGTTGDVNALTASIAKTTIEESLREETTATEERAKVTKSNETAPNVYYFYQAPDGQPVMLHSACMRVLLEHHGSYEALPLELEGDVVEIENKTQDEEVRKRAAHIRHLPLTTEFVMIELDMKPLVHKKILDGAAGNELRQRAKRRSQKNAAEARAKAKEKRAEAIAKVKSQPFSKSVRDSMPALGSNTSDAPPPTPDTSLDAAIARAMAEQAEEERERMAMYEEVQNARGPDGQRSFSSIVGLGFASGGPNLNFNTGDEFGPALGSSPPVTTAPIWGARGASPATSVDDNPQGSKKKGKGKQVLFRIG